MNNINIVINKATRMVELSKRTMGNDGENLQSSLVFSFNDEFVDGQARLEIILPSGDKEWFTLTKENETYIIPIKSVITKEGKIDMQLVIDEGTNNESIPIFKSNTFYIYVNESINAVEEAPEGYEQWIEIANAKLTQMDNLDIDATQTSTGATIIITKKDGTTESVQVLNGIDGQNGTDGQDGVGLDYNWINTSLGVKREDETNYQYVNLQGPPGAPGSIRMVIVNQLPETGEEGTLYFVPKQDTSTSDLYDEYIWINNAWELLGTKQITVDLSDYYKKEETYSQAQVNALIPDLTNYVQNTDYASVNTAGIIKTGTYGTILDNNKRLSPVILDYNTYLNQSGLYFVSKGTLENVITGKGLTTKAYVDGLVGDIASVLDTINGEVI